MIALLVGNLRAVARYQKLLAFIAGVATVLSFAPFGLSWLAPVLLAALFLLWEGNAPREAAWTGFWFGFGLFSAGTWWLYISLNILGGLAPPLAVFMMFCLFATMGAFVALIGWLTVRLSLSGSLLRFLLVAPAVWTLIEWLRGWVFSGFPWLSLGYGQAESLFGAFAPVAGVYGVTWLVCLVAGGLAGLMLAAPRDRLIALATLVAAVGVAWLAGQQQWTTPAGEALRVKLVQGAIPQELKWLPSQLDPTLERYAQLSINGPDVDLIVWPEVAIPAQPFEVDDYLKRLEIEMLDRDTQLFTGILDFDMAKGQYVNTLLAVGAEAGRYRKRHLVPFGEYFPVPDFVKQWLRLMNLPSEDIAKGAPDQPLLLAKGVPVAATICYEIAFGGEQLRFLPEAQLLVNVSNDAWFGDSFAPHQHVQMGQMRSLETGRWLMRVTNTGITAIINADGEIIGRIPQFEPGSLLGAVRPRTGATPYVRFGNALIVTLCLVLLGAGFGFGRR